MTDKKIDSLPLQDYSQKKRRMYNIPGEPAAIRHVDHRDQLDMQRYREVNNMLATMGEFVGGASTDRSLIIQARSEQAGRRTKKTDTFAFVVAGAEETVNKDEVGEYQGYVSYNPVAEDEIAVMKEKGLIPENVDNSMVLEVTYAKRPGAPAHQIASALRQACIQVARIEGEHFKNAQEKTNTQPETIITACIKKENQASIRVAEAAGFERKGEVNFDDEPEDDELLYQFYVLSWEKLHDSMRAKTDPAFIAYLKS